MATAIQPYVDPAVVNKENAPPANDHLDVGSLAKRVKELASKSGAQSQSAPAAQGPSRQPLAPRSEASLAHAQSQLNAARTSGHSASAHESSAAHSRQKFDESVLAWNDSHALSPKEQESRDRFVQNVRKHPEVPQAWLDLLNFDNALHQRGKPHPHEKTLQLYVAATMVLPPLKNDPVYGKIWIDYAIALAGKDHAEARTVFKSMERSGIAQDSYSYYLTFASFEWRHDRQKQAMAVLRQGIERGIPDRNVLEEKLKNYAQRETKTPAVPAVAPSLSATSSAAAPVVAQSAHVAVAPTLAPAMTVSAAPIVPSAPAPAPAPALSVVSAVPPPTPSVSAQPSQEPVTPSAGLAGANTPASRRRGIRPLGLNTAKLGGATRVKATEVISAIDDEEDIGPSTPAAPTSMLEPPERAMERSVSMPARTNPVPAPPPGAAPHPPAPTTGHTAGVSERTANSSLAAPSPMSHRSTHHLTTSTGASGYFSSVNNSALSTSSSSSSASSASSASSGSGSSPPRVRQRQSVPSFPSTPQPATLNTNNSVALLPESITPAAPVSRPALAPIATAAPAPTHAPVSVPSANMQITAPPPAIVAAPKVAPQHAVAPVALSAIAPATAAPALAARAVVAPPVSIAPTSLAHTVLSVAPQPAAAPAGASAAPVPTAAAAPKEMTYDAWAKKEQEDQQAEHDRMEVQRFMRFAKGMEQLRLEDGKSDLPAKPFWVKGKPYVAWSGLGKGGYSVVYKAVGADMSFYALKVIAPKQDEDAVRSSTENEVSLLEQLKGEPSIIQLKAYEIPEDGKQIALVFELGDTDLDQMFKSFAAKEKPMALTDRDAAPRRPWLDENFIRFQWSHMLRAVQAIHNHKIVHSDLKPANFVLVRGVLKLIDFGISGKIETNQTSVVRPQFVGTVCYMAPETFVGVQTGSTQSQKVGRASDVWSLGCILYQMVYGKPPYFEKRLHERLELYKSGKRLPSPPLTNPALWAVMQQCLSLNPKERPKIPELLNCEFLAPKGQSVSS